MTLSVLHVISDSDRRGGQIFARDLHHELQSSGIASRLVAVVPGGPGGLSVECLGTTRFSARGLWKLRRLMAEADVTIAHGSTTVMACAVAGGGKRRPFVVRQISESRFWLDSRWRQRRVAVYLRRAAGVIALAQSAADELQRLTGTPAAKFAIVANGVPAARFDLASDVDRAEARRAFGVPATSTTFCCVGALVAEKGVDRAIAATARTPGAHLLVAGDGPERRQLEEQANSSAPGRVHFLGSLPDPSAVYASSDLLLLPSRGGDSMPAVIIEAGFCGVPSVATDVGAIRALVAPGSGGAVVPQADFADAVRAYVDANATHAAESIRSYYLERFEIRGVAIEWTSALKRLRPGLANSRADSAR